jgi:hypothetical protein
MGTAEIAIGSTVLDTWFERDRQHVCLSRRQADGSAGGTIIEWWDGAVTEAVDDGFLNPRNYHASAFEYARSHGLLSEHAPVSIKPAPRGTVMASESLGVYLGWLPGGAPIWSARATEEQKAKGAWVYNCEEEAREDVASDAARATDGIEFASVAERDAFLAGRGLPGDLSFWEVELDVTPKGMRQPTRASLGACADAGVDLPDGQGPAPGR